MVSNDVPMEIHETAVEVQRLERLHTAAVAREAELRDKLKKARKARDKAILADPNTIAAQVAERYGVSDTWVKRLRKGKSDTAAQQ